MNQLAQLAYRLATGQEVEGNFSLTAAQQAAVKGIGPMVSQAPEALAALLSDGDTPPIDWMVPPSGVVVTTAGLN